MDTQPLEVLLYREEVATHLASNITQVSQVLRVLSQIGVQQVGHCVCYTHTHTLEIHFNLKIAFHLMTLGQYFMAARVPAHHS